MLDVWLRYPIAHHVYVLYNYIYIHAIKHSFLGAHMDRAKDNSGFGEKHCSIDHLGRRMLKTLQKQGIHQQFLVKPLFDLKNLSHGLLFIILFLGHKKSLPHFPVTMLPAALGAGTASMGKCKACVMGCLVSKSFARRISLLPMWGTMDGCLLSERANTTGENTGGLCHHNYCPAGLSFPHVCFFRPHETYGDGSDHQCRMVPTLWQTNISMENHHV